MRPVTVRVSIDPLLSLVGGSSPRVALRLGVDQRTILRWRTEGVSELQADRAAIALGFHPYEVWPELVEEALLSA